MPVPCMCECVTSASVGVRGMQKRVGEELREVLVEFGPLLSELMLRDEYDAILIRAVQYYVLQPANKAVCDRRSACSAQRFVWAADICAAIWRYTVRAHARRHRGRDIRYRCMRAGAVCVCVCVCVCVP